MPASYIALYALAMLIPIGAYVIALVIAARNRQRAPRAANLLAWGLGIWLAGRILLTFIPIFATRMVAAATMAYVSVGTTVLAAIINIAGLIFVVRAVFVDREHRSPGDANVFLKRDGTTVQTDGNPYVTPGSS